jgi:ubiquinone/menaquinone biosynthesis C-methylase UbiE
MTEPYGQLDPWITSTSFEAAQARDLASLLQARAATEDERAARAAYLDLLDLRPGERVLEVGCGNGIVLCDLARRVTPPGLSIGLDPSPALLAIARELAARAVPGASVQLCQGDARALPFKDGQFDAVLAATTLAHIPDGQQAILEMVRVTGPGGRVGILEQDPDSYLLSHPDRALTRRIVAAYTDQGYANGWLARQLPRMLTSAGLQDVRVRAFASIETDLAGFYSTRAERAAATAARAGAISEQERERWMEVLNAERVAGGFFAGLTLLFVWGTRLPAPDR